MLDVYFTAVIGQVEAYGRMLGLIRAMRIQGRAPESYDADETELTDCIKAIETKPMLFRRQLRAVLEYAIQTRVASGHGPVTIGKMTGATPLLVAWAAVRRAVEGWRNCKAIADRSRVDPRYAYQAEAEDLFIKTHIRNLPEPDQLLAWLELERADVTSSFNKSTDHPSVQTHAEKSIGPSYEPGATGPTSVGNSRLVSPRKRRISRGNYEPRIAEYLRRRPLDTALEVSQAVGCSVGVVAESSAWKVNMHIRSMMRPQAGAPNAVSFNDVVMNANGWDPNSQFKRFREIQSEIDDQIDDRLMEESAVTKCRAMAHGSEAPLRTNSHGVGRKRMKAANREAELAKLVEEQKQDQLEDDAPNIPGSQYGRGRKRVKKRV